MATILGNLFTIHELALPEKIASPPNAKQDNRIQAFYYGFHSRPFRFPSRQYGRTPLSKDRPVDDIILINDAHVEEPRYRRIAKWQIVESLKMQLPCYNIREENARYLTVAVRIIPASQHRQRQVNDLPYILAERIVRAATVRERLHGFPLSRE